MTLRDQISDDVEAVFFDVDAFADSVAYTTAAGDASTIVVVVETENREDGYTESGREAPRSIVVEIKRSDIDDPGVNDAMEFDGETWTLTRVLGRDHATTTARFEAGGQTERTRGGLRRAKRERQPMPQPPSAGPLSLAEPRLGLTLANCTEWRAATGAADADEAAESIYYHALPPPANGSRYTADELDDLRPFAIVSTDYPNGYRYRKIGEYAWDDAGRLVLEIEAAIDDADNDDDAEAMRKFNNTLGKIIQLQTNDADTNRGLLDLFNRAPDADHVYLNGSSVRVMDIVRNEKKDAGGEGNFFRAYLLVEWGVQGI